MRARLAPLALVLTLICAPALAQDADLDGVPNLSDTFPCDAAVSAQAFAPAQDTHGMMLVEDQWPAPADDDANDLVVTYNYAYQLDALGRTHRLQVTLNVLAMGGIFTNGLALTLPVPRGDVASVHLSVESGPSVPLIPSARDADLTVVVQSSLRRLFGDAQGAINSRSDLNGVPGVMMVLDVALAVPTVLAPSEAPYDLFLFRTADPTHEIHRTQYGGSAQMNPGLFGTLDDGSVPGRRFVDRQGLPAVILLPQSTPYPAEGVPLSALFPNIVGFASSGGTSQQDFYTSQVQPAAQYSDRNGQGAPAPRAAPTAVDTSCVSQADTDGDGFIAAVDCDDLNPQVYPGRPELCDGLDNDCNQLIDDGVSGNFSTYYRDADQDGFGDPASSISACGPPSGYVQGNGACTNGQVADCNPPGATLIASSAYRHPSPPAGWRQCAGFINTAGDDVAGNVLDNCLGQGNLRVIVTNLSTGQVEEDVSASGMSNTTVWPSWSYLGGSLISTVSTYWGSTSFFVTTDGRDACGHSVGSPGQPSFGSGNGAKAIIVGGDTGAHEYRVNCSGQSLVNRSIVVLAQDPSASSFVADCDDGDALNFPGNTEVCDGQDNNCDGVTDEGLTQTFFFDQDQDGFGVQSQAVVACSAPPGYVAGGSLCTNGSFSDCNPSGTTLTPSSAYVDPAPPSGWQQCAGFINTTGDDVSGRFLDNCLGKTSLRVIVSNLSTGQVEEDVQSTTLNGVTSWPGWDYLGGSLSATVRTHWGTTTYFVTTDGRDACGQGVSTSGQPTFGSGNGSKAIIVGHDSGANEYRVNCGGQSLTGRSVALYTQNSGPVAAFDCDDNDGAVSPGATEVCNGVDDDCDGASDENNPGGNLSCATGLSGVCSAGLTQCTSGGLACVATGGQPTEVCGDGVDNNCDGQTDEPICSLTLCSNGSATDCNPSGTTRISGSRYVDQNPPAGWTQCAGFMNTPQDDVTGRFMDNCLGSTRLRVIVRSGATGQVQEDVQSTTVNGLSSWPSWSYLGGSLISTVSTYWGSTSFFVTTDGRDACGHSVGASGQPTFGSGNGSRAIIVGHDAGAYEYRVNCSGQALTGRTVALYR